MKALWCLLFGHVRRTDIYGILCASNECRRCGALPRYENRGQS